MNVLVACEESQVVTSAFRALGHNAFSCDLRKCTGGFPEWHILGDCLDLINGFCLFVTCNGEFHYLGDTWDLVIAHPPCTYLSKVGACKLFDSNGCIKDCVRYHKGLAARHFFMTVFHCNAKRLCVENPVPLRIFNLPPRSDTIQPHMFGDAYSKKTLLWLRDLPPLFPTLHCANYYSWTALHSSSRLRSKTFPGVAAAMAHQWGDLPVRRF